MQSTVDTLVYRELIEAPRELASTLKFHAERHGGVADITTGADTATLNLTYSITRPTVLGELHKGAWTPSPNLHNLPTPTLDSVTCALCQQESHRRYLYIHQADGPNVWLGATCASRSPQFRRVTAPRPFEKLHAIIGNFDTRERFDTDRVVAEAIREIRNNGYTSARQSFEGQPSTADRVKEALQRPMSPEVESVLLDAQMLLLLVQDTEPADEFAESIKYVACLEEVTVHSVGLLCFLPEMLQRTALREKLPTPVNAFFGQPGERMTCVAVFCSERHTYTGTRIMKYIEKTSGAQLVWFCTSMNVTAPKPGTEQRVCFTVKRHSEYRGQRSTVVNRLSVKTQ